MGSGYTLPHTPYTLARVKSNSSPHEHVTQCNVYTRAVCEGLNICHTVYEVCMSHSVMCTQGPYVRV